MRAIRKFYNRISDALTMRVIAVLLLAVLILSLLPILYCSFFVRATGDDLGYSAALHHVMIHGGGIADALRAIWNQVVQSWYGYQGTWSSIILFQLQPGIWGDAVYGITPWISLGFIASGTWFFLREILCRRQDYDRSFLAAVFSILLFCQVQYIPKIRGGIFWYTSVAHYCIPYGVALLSVSSAMAFQRTGRKRNLVAAAIGSTYLGGAGYPPIVLAACLYFLLLLSAIPGSWANITGVDANTAGSSHAIRLYRRRTLWILLPFTLLMAGFIVNAIAPGNKVRGGSDFGFSAERVLTTLREAFAEGASAGIGYVKNGRLIPLCIILTAVLTWCQYKTSATPPL